MGWDIIVVSFLSGGFAGGIAGSYLNNRFAKERDSVARQFARAMATESRKTEFLGFMDGCFRSEATKIRSDYRTEFWNLVESLSSLGRSEIQEGSNQGDNAPGQKKLLTRLDAVVAFVRAN